jgi:hypothetical protein
MRTEISLAELAEARRLWTAFWKIELLQRPVDPDIDRKGPLETKREEQNTIGDFDADTGKTEQHGARLIHRQFGEAGQIDFPGRQRASRGRKVRSAKTEFAFPQFRFGSFGNSGGSGKGEHGINALRHNQRLAKTPAQQRNDLPNLHDLLGR